MTIVQRDNHAIHQSADRGCRRGVAGWARIRAALRMPGRLCIGVVIASLVACGQDKANAPSAGAVGGPPKAMPVTVMAVEPENIPLTLDAAGRAEGSKQVEIRARVSGVIEKILFNEGERVALGAPMYQLERASFEISLAQARSAADQARARVDQARRQRERLRQLNQQSLISKREYDDALVAERTAEAAFAVEQSRVAAAELESVLYLDRCTHRRYHGSFGTVGGQPGERRRDRTPHDHRGHRPDLGAICAG